MYHYGFRPQEYYTIMYLQPNPLVPYTFGPYSEVNNGFLFPSIQMHNFTSRPNAFAGDPYHPQNGHVEYHHFYGANPIYSSPAWYYPSYNTMPAYSPWMNYNNSHSQQRANSIVWPEGFTMKGELLWGRLDRIFGVKRDLPEFVKEDLRRVYGTYPRTFVAITYQNGEYLVKADPKVGEQEYTVEKKVIRRQPTPSDSEDEISDNRNSKKKKRKPRR